MGSELWTHSREEGVAMEEMVAHGSYLQSTLRGRWPPSRWHLQVPVVFTTASLGPRFLEESSTLISDY